ncbi:MAG TPA: hypothetical protein VFI93_11440 [Rhizomicrobium sp.]|nr:hypothetical protein [Rhizomicrobium sp.]
MAEEKIREGLDVFVHDGDRSFGLVRQLAPEGKPAFVIYVENGGDFVVPLSAVKAVHANKLVLDGNKIEPALAHAIKHAHDREDPTIG